MSKDKETQKTEANLAIKKTPLPLTTELEMDQDILAFLPRAESSDFDIPRLTLIQPTSKIEGSAGDLIASDSGLKVSGMNEKLEFVPVTFLKDYAVSEVDSQKFRRNEPKTPDNAKHSVFDNRIDTDPDGVAVEYKERLNLFIVMAADLDDDFPRLYRLILKPGSFKEAKKFLSEWDIQIRSRLFPFTYMWSITPKEVRNEKGKFSILEFQKVLDGKKQRQITKEQVTGVSNWVKMINSNKAAAIKDTDGGDEEEEFKSGIPL